MTLSSTLIMILVKPLLNFTFTRCSYIIFVKLEFKYREKKRMFSHLKNNNSVLASSLVDGQSWLWFLGLYFLD